MGLESSEEIELYKALIAAREKYSRMQTRLIKEQAIMIELLEERNAALETKLCELVIEKRILREIKTCDTTGGFYGSA